MYFMLMLMTNPETTSIGVYRITIRQMAFYSKYDPIAVNSILTRFEDLGLIVYDRESKEICIKGYSQYSINKGGKPMEDLIRKELSDIRNIDFIKTASKYVKINGLTDVFDERIKDINDSCHDTYDESYIDTGDDIDIDIDKDIDKDKDNIEIVEEENSSTLSVPEDNYDNLKNQKEKKSSPPPEIFEIIEYLNDATGSKFNPETNSHIKFIRARLDDGAKVQELKDVIDMKAREWINDEKMSKYLRPQTLFNKTKYEGYREDYGKVGNKIKATKRLQVVVDDFVSDNKMNFVWDAREIEALEQIASKLKVIMQSKGEDMSMDNMEVVLNQVLERLDDFYLDKFSMKIINSNLNSILNGKSVSKKREWERLVASFD